MVLNIQAKAVIEEQRHQHEHHVFHYKGKPVQSLYNTAWKEARSNVNLPYVRIHELKHTYGARLRAAGVNFEDRQDLLGHKGGRVTTHYSAPQLINLIQESELVCVKKRHKSGTVIILRKKIPLRVACNASG